MTYKVILPVEDNKVVVTLPPNFSGKRKVLVFVEDEIMSNQQKIDDLKAAINDPLFISDVKEIHQDFDAIDNETV